MYTLEDAYKQERLLTWGYVEANYRRGYRDGWIAATNAAVDIYFLRDLDWIYNILYDHWCNDLKQWVMEEPCARVVFPPYVLRRSLCVYCGKRQASHKDHVVPKSRGGLNNRSNLVPSCRFCNMKKRNRTPEECGFEIDEEILKARPPTP